MAALNLNAISLSRPTPLHNAQGLERCRSTATKNSAGNRSVLVTRPQRHVVTSSLRRKEAKIAAVGEDGSLLADMMNKVALPVMLCAALATTLAPGAALAGSSGGRVGGSNFNRTKASSSSVAPRRDVAPPPRETVRETVRTETTNVVVIQQAPPPLFGIPLFVPIVPFGGGFGGGNPGNTRELEQNREVDLRQAEDIAALKAKNDFEQLQIQDLKNELYSLRAK
mmetsp:Transcript_34385/g.57734  ORF Transcript_34385/g.57734 Transcript_34385/m.57734 type:complete len:225 (+) Transcript_34385:130-804(+)|eukprot:CAMPEP_0198214008 /NCGR_PEP_ID=MMETSP1445-20131203/36312_1 /TAXON_ID=36898 /ORGANISM="Pyramimonas sp., Strain CCMP2087" /LENGTH=224 /DNA_ID=CAMNT_0043888943 /DNA_START=98 /DNA_END=772 /DNA_ORIENTATION=+